MNEESHAPVGEGSVHPGSLAACPGCAPTPPEESLCGEEEALAAGDHPPVEAGTTFDDFLRDLRGRGRSAQRVTAETLDLVGAWHAAWLPGFIQGADQAYTERGGEPLSGRELESLRFFALSFQSALRTLLDKVRAVERGGR